MPKKRGFEFFYKYFIRWFIAGLIFVFVLVLTTYLFEILRMQPSDPFWQNIVSFMDYAFVQDFVSNLMATIVGVALGIPIAFWINTRVEIITRRDKNKRILGILSLELHKNKEQIEKWKVDSNQRDELTTLGESLDDEGWKSFSDGGELQWVWQAWTQYKASIAYDQIRRVRYLSDKYFELVMFRKNSTARNVVFVEGKLRAAIVKLEDDIDQALVMIDYDRSLFSNQSWLEKTWKELRMKIWSANAR